MDTVEVFLIWVAIIGGYWAPTIVAFSRHIPNKWQVAVVNFFGFFLGIGWVIALVWAIKPDDGQGAHRIRQAGTEGTSPGGTRTTGQHASR